MKKLTLVYLIGGAYLAWFLLRKKKIGANNISAIDAASTAKQMVSDTVDQTTFLPDTTTLKDLYNTDQNFCR